MYSGVLYKRQRSFSGYMPAGREGERVTPFDFALPPLKFHGAGFGGSLLLEDTCQRVGRVHLLSRFLLRFGR